MEPGSQFPVPGSQFPVPGFQFPALSEAFIVPRGRVVPRTSYFVDGRVPVIRMPNALPGRYRQLVIS